MKLISVVWLLSICSACPASATESAACRKAKDDFRIVTSAQFNLLGAGTQLQEKRPDLTTKLNAKAAELDQVIETLKNLVDSSCSEK